MESQVGGDSVNDTRLNAKAPNLLPLVADPERLDLSDSTRARRQVSSTGFVAGTGEGKVFS